MAGSLEAVTAADSTPFSLAALEDQVILQEYQAEIERTSSTSSTSSAIPISVQPPSKSAPQRVTAADIRLFLAVERLKFLCAAGFTTFAAPLLVRLDADEAANFLLVLAVWQSSPVVHDSPSSEAELYLNYRC